MNERTKRPTMSFLTRENKEHIYRTALRILDTIGMQVLHDEAIKLLKREGCAVEKDNIVKVPASLIERAIQSAPHNIPIYNREGDFAMDCGGYRSYFGTGSDLIYSLNSEKMERTLCVLDDVSRAARVCDALPNIDFIMSFAHPSDIYPQCAFLKSFQAMAENSVKPIVCTASSREDLGEMWEIAKILRDGEENLQFKSYFIHYAEPISPLKHPFPSLDKLLFCAENSVPVIYSPAPIAGSTAPMTIAGHVAQGLAESLFGLVIHQLKSEGAPFIMGMGPAILDMATGQCSYNAPEYYLAYMAMIEMSHYFDLPSWGYAGMSDSKIPDQQASYEAGICTFMSAISGANLNHDVGYLDFGRTGSLEMVIILDEIIDQVRRLMKGITVDDEMLGLDVVREVGHKGNFITHDHTLKHLRSTQWRPKLINRSSYEKWEKSGSTSFLDRARQRLSDILDNHRPPKLNEEKIHAIQSLVDTFPTE